MGHSQAEKAKNRERILEAAAEEIRQHGLEALSVGKIMQKVGLTHGGFYGHFDSRSDLLAQALKRALVDGESVSRSARDPKKKLTLSTMSRSYLSRKHRDSRRSGCAISALVSDVGRADEACRDVMDDHIESFITKVEDAIGDDKEAIVAVSAMIGALAISRVITDERRSDTILKSVCDVLVAKEKD